MPKKPQKPTLQSPDTPDTYGDEYFGYVPPQENSKPSSNYGRIRGGYDPVIHAAPEMLKDALLEFLSAIEDRDESRPIHFLEVGCATGLTVELLSGLGYLAVGIDLSRFIVTEMSLSPRVFHADMYDIYGAIAKIRERFPEFGIDADVFLYSKDVLEHVPYDLIESLLGAFASVSKYQWHQINTGQHEYQAWDGDVTHRIRETVMWWSEMLSQSGATYFQVRET